MVNAIENKLDEVKEAISRLKEMVAEVNFHLQKPEVRQQDELWTVNQVAAYLRKSKGTIQSHYQNKPGFPRSVKIGNSRYWKPGEIIAWAQKRQIH